MTMHKTSSPASHSPLCRKARSGNILFIILIAIGLMGALTIVISDGFSGAKGTSERELKGKADSILRYSRSVKDAVTLLYTNDVKETDLLFAHPKGDPHYGIDPNTNADRQVFSEIGGGAQYLWPIPEGINDGSKWEFSGYTRAPHVGIDTNPDLLIILPNVNLKFCQAVNAHIGYAEDATPPADAGSCNINHATAAPWAGDFPSSSNTMYDGTNFTQLPASYGCVTCGSVYHYFYVLLER